MHTAGGRARRDHHLFGRSGLHTGGVAIPPHVGRENRLVSGIDAVAHRLPDEVVADRPHPETVRRELESRKSKVSATVLCPGAIDTGIVASDRNRPPGSAPPSPAHIAFQENAGDLVRKGKKPEEVGAMVVEAIRENRFWIVTHPDWLPVLQERVEGMIDGGRLTSGFGG